MKNLERHITQLIAHHNCVIIPGLGAFLTHNVPAEYNIDEQVFMPPHRTLGFNPMVNVDDALLVSDYMEQGKYTYEKASEMMRNDINALRRLLSCKSIVRFGELGTFSMNINGCITFTPDANGIDDPENYGFEPLAIQQLHRQQEKTITIKRRELRKYVAAVAAIILTFLFVTPISDQAFENNYKASLGGFASSEQISMMQQLSEAAPVQVAGSESHEITPIKFSKTSAMVSEEPTTPSSVDKEPAEVVHSNPVPAETIQQAIINNTEAATAIPTANTEENTATVSKRHYIIVASSPNAENAQLAISELTAKREAGYTVLRCGKRHRIAINSYDSEKEAQEALPEYQSTFADAWILTY